MKKTMTRADVLKLLDDWRAERDPADAYTYADLMAQIIEKYTPSAPDEIVVTVAD